jgi:hypothetical protein
MCGKAPPFRRTNQNSSEAAPRCAGRMPAFRRQPALLPMTRRTARQNIRSLNAKSLNQLKPFLLLIRRRSPFHIEDFRTRPHKILRTAMTFQTPFHLQRISLRHHRHLIDAAVTGRAADAFADMNRVIEISEVRQVVHANPFQGLARFETGAYRLEIRTVGPNLFVTVHADRRRRHAGRRGRLNRGVAVTTVDAVIADVMLVTELDWLLAFDPLAGVPSRASDLCRDPQRQQQNKNRAVDRGPRQIVRAVTENLWHRRREDKRAFGLVADLSAYRRERAGYALRL